ncbi:MAG: hypothetical protein H7263_12285 [Candidatus Sericytochromatia bacterium]|nr:hypothetical protein [Candidatus Sericytochromatia bacterium]
MKLYRNLVFLLPIMIYGCNNTLNSNINRTNPSSLSSSSLKPSAKPSFSIPPNSLSSELPDPIKTPETKSEDFIYNVEIKFNSSLGRAYVDEGPLTATPTTFKVRGGNHKIIVLDLISSCQIAKNYYIDKDMVLDFTGKESCINDRSGG